MKYCSNCKETKVKDKFSKNKCQPDGYSNWCKICANQNSKAHHYKSKYGITLDEYDEMFTKQNGKCSICKTTDPKGKYNRFHVDHDHVTGKIRSLLCSACNMGLGLFQDNPSLLLDAACYLKKHGKD